MRPFRAFPSPSKTSARPRKRLKPPMGSWPSLAVPAGLAALVVVPVVALFVGLASLHQIDSLRRLAAAPGTVPTREIISVNLGYGILASVFLVVGLAAVFDGLWSLRSRRNRSDPGANRLLPTAPPLPPPPVPPPEPADPLQAGAEAAFRALEAELRLASHRLSPPAVVAFHGVLERARRRAFLEIPSTPPSRAFSRRPSDGPDAPPGPGAPPPGTGSRMSRGPVWEPAPPIGTQHASLPSSSHGRRHDTTPTRNQVGRRAS